MRYTRSRVVLAFSIILMGLSVSGVIYAAGAPLMSVPGGASVSAGIFNYSIPIAVPPGTAGMVPRLSLDYSSASTDGFVGWGWSLDGLDVITRCARNLTIDGIHGSVNYDMNDRFCLNGQRLMVLSGTYGADGSTYATYVDTYSKIVAHGSAGNGPAWFEVHLKSGVIEQLGNTADSAVQAVGTSTNREWWVNKVTDPSGNYFTATYTEDSGTARPSHIDYTGNASAGLATYNSVQFVYTYPTPRADTYPSYQAGSSFQNQYLLTHIQTKAGAQVISDYQLGYRAGTATLHSRLTSVTLCDGGSGAGQSCLAPTQFTWQGGAGLTSMSGSTNSLAQGMGLMAGDFNADGLTDALVLNGSCPAGGVIFSGFNTGGFTAANMTANYTYWTNTSPAVEQPYSGAACFMGSPLIGDLNADGYADVMQNLQYWITGTDPHWGHFDGPLLNTTSGALNQPGSVDTSLPSMLILGDFNGDGRMDGYGSAPNRGIYSSDGDGTFTMSASILNSNRLYGGDFDGDGCMDVLGQGSPDEIVYTCNPAVPSASVPNLSSTNLVTGDFNGDLMTDVLVVDTNAVNSAVLYLSTGTGLDSGHTISNSSSWGDLSKYNLVEGDWNGDGRADVALISVVSGSPHLIFLSTGTGFVQAATIPDTDGYDTGVAADWNNDGATDLWIKSTSDKLYTPVFGSSSYLPERIVSVDDGMGKVITVAYDRLNKNGSFYTKGTGATYPSLDFDGPSYVVSSISTSNGIGGNFTTTYKYGDLRVNVTDPPKQNTLPAGFLSFSSITSTDAQTGFVTTTNYRTDIPYVGLVSSQATVSGSTTLKSVTNSYAAANETGGSYALTLTQSALTQHDLDGATLPSVTTSYTYDGYGNPLTISQVLSDGSSKTTTNTYSNNTGTWILGRLLSSSVTSTVPDNTAGGGGNGTNGAPTANTDTISTDKNTAKTIDPRANDTDPDGDALVITTTTAPSHGTAASAGSSVTYTPVSGYTGSDSFTYTVNDGHGHSAVGTVNVTVVNHPPVASNDSASVNENSAVTVSPLSNDSDPDGDTITISAVGSPGHGSTTHTSTSITYTPTHGYSGSDSFSYTISDGHGNTDSATVTVTVVNRAPNAVNDSASVNENYSVTISPLSNDTDPDGDTLTISAVGGPGHGSTTHTSTGITYTPTHGYSGTDSFTYTVSDGHGHTDSATVTVTVVNRPPVTQPDAYTVTTPPQPGHITFNPLGNDSDPDGDSLSIIAVSSPPTGHGSVTFSGNLITFSIHTVAPGFADFTYTVSDGHGHTAIGYVEVTYQYLECTPQPCKPP